MRILLILVFIISVVSCDVKYTMSEIEISGEPLDPKSEQSENNLSSYEEYINNIPVLELPFSFNCKKDLESISLNLNEEIIKKHKPEGAEIYGRFKTSKSFSVILYLYPGDIMWPAIVTSNSSNKKISEIQPLDGNCWDGLMDPIGFCNCELTIDQNLNITAQKQFEEKEVLGTYQINETGVIQKIE